MARRIVHQLVDDIDGTVLGVGEGETVHFSLNSTAYEIDLTTENADEFRKALEPYIAGARRASAAGARSGSARKRSAASPETAAIREWANENGHQVSERGRIPATVIEAYRAAH
ncbi:MULTISPECIES: Lsr2 family protein [unclassified Microbacterium]|uniref:histone-like nucleoid-structuring protein Lsr2 n=1 Tax=unclassified Microbacterium TaxID=2609290 RepID=UPI001D571499|nr:MULTISPECIES: Lsr2 family protein [unclassified Microbacterium]CAH0190092.1 Nucleoid-associated protein Lsr2 [Microbacterium sp. Bi121]HWK78188.1 Lsr2 family protein [Microbacterium sp.]